MFIKKKNTTAASASSFFSSCFGGSPVSEADGPPKLPCPAGDAKNKDKDKLVIMALFSWPSFGGKGKTKTMKRRKKKKASTVPFDLASPAASSSSQFYKRASSPKAQRIPCGRNDQEETTAASPLQLKVCADSYQASHPTTSTKPTTQTGPAQPGPSPDQAQPPSPITPRHRIRRFSTQEHLARPGRTKPAAAGLWIMVTALGVMLLLGRVSAVLFLCTCWYGLPLARATAGGSEDAGGGTAAGVDLDSEEYKKRVVMEGLLERNTRRPSVFYGKAA